MTGVVNTLSGAKPKSGTAHVNIGVYGGPGAGKTFAATDVDLDIFELDHHEILYLNVDNGDLTLRVNNRKCNVLDITKFNKTVDKTKLKPGEFADPFSHLEAIQRDLLVGNHGYKLVVLDSLTSLQQDDLDTITQSSGRTNGYSKQQGDYGLSTDKISWLMRAYRDLPMHVVFIFGETNRKDPVTGKQRIVPNLTPALIDILYPLMDIIGYVTSAPVEQYNEETQTNVVVMQHMTYFDKDYDGYLLKDRSGVLRPYKVDIRVPGILKLVYDKLS